MGERKRKERLECGGCGVDVCMEDGVMGMKLEREKKKKRGV